MTIDSSIADEARFLRLVRDGSEWAREVYADWLEQRGHLDRALLMRHADPAGALMSLMDWLLRESLWSGATTRRGHVFSHVVMDSVYEVRAPQGEANIIWRPLGGPFRVYAVIVPDEIAPWFSFRDIAVGNMSQFEPYGSPIPCTMFTARALHERRMPMRLDTCQTSQDFVLEVINTSDTARRFWALICGQIFIF